MAEPSTSAGVSLTVIFVALLGPMAGPYALIAFAASPHSSALRLA